MLDTEPAPANRRDATPTLSSQMLLALLAGCLFDRATYERRLNELTDHDGDGFAYEDDCDDDDAAISPSTIELCDAVDQDCDGEIDDGFAGRTETCDGTDEDCDGVIDEEATDGTTWYGDADEDGHGLASVVTTACSQPANYSADGTDCDDANDSKYPGATETAYDGVDQDCSGADLVDVDGDGAAAEEAGGEDCDDADPSIYPSAPETWEDGFEDNDCVAGNEGVREEYGTDAFTGRIAGGRAGGNLAALGDVDGDGSPEFAVAAFYDSTYATLAGAVFVVDSPTPQPLANFTSIETTEETSFLGSAIDTADLDGGGTMELLVTATGSEEGRGLVAVIRAEDLAYGVGNDLADVAAFGIRGPHAAAYLGARARFLPDADGDGLLEIGCTAPLAEAGGSAAAGAAYVFSGTSLLESGGIVEVSAADRTITGTVPGDSAGNGLEPAGDQNGDGLDDLVVYDGIDELWLIPGGSNSGTADEIAISRALDAVADGRMLDDVDGDGREDVLVLGASPYVLADLSAQPTWLPSEAYSTLNSDGNAVTAAISLGDRTGDGKSETLFFEKQNAALGTGWAGVVPGDAWSFGGTIDFNQITLDAVSTRPGSAFGYHAANVGNVGGDATDFFAVGGWLDDEAGVDAGAVALLPIPR